MLRLHLHRNLKQSKIISLLVMAGFVALATGAAAAEPPAAQPAAAQAPATSPAGATGAATDAPAAGAAASPAPGGTAVKVNHSDPNVQAPTTSVNIFSGLMDPFDYDSRGRRDPFAQKMADQAVSGGLVHGPLLPLQRYDLNQLRVMAILWDVKRPQAMIKDPNGNIYIITPNSKIGPHNGYVAAIREGEIVVIETQEQDGRLVSTAQVVKIAK